MDLRFDIGNAESPAGHALLYFSSAADGKIYATYVMVLPIRVDLEKYVPPALSSFIQGGELGASPAATAMPPVAETVESLAWLQTLAHSRRDDLVDAGSIYSAELPNVLQMTQEGAAEYARLYDIRTVLEGEYPTPAVNSYADLGEAERLTELTRLVGQLRDALGTSVSDEVFKELQLLAETMPSKYRMDELLDWARRAGATGQDLATLHLQRSYKLLSEEYLGVADIERQIRELQARQSPPG